MATRWYYQGDVNLEYGGIFFDFSELRHGYVTAVRVEDLDSACGFTSAVMIEELTVSMPDKADQSHAREQSALSAIGASYLPNGDIDDNGRRTYRKGTLAHKMCLAYAMVAYGHFDVDRSEIVQPDRTAPTQFESWTATRIRVDGLKGYVRRNFLGLRR